MNAVALILESDQERTVLAECAEHGCYMLDDRIEPPVTLSDVEAVEAKAAKLILLASIWRLAQLGAGYVDAKALEEIRSYREVTRRYVDDCVYDVQCGRGPDEISLLEAKVEATRGELALLDHLLDRVDPEVTA